MVRPASLWHRQRRQYHEVLFDTVLSRFQCCVFQVVINVHLQQSLNLQLCICVSLRIILKHNVQTSYNFKMYCLQVPHSQQDWESIAASLDAKWQFSNCIGTMDGKHIALKAPATSGSTFYNYKLFDSIVLMAVVDAHYGVIIMFDVTVI